ncbi:SusC/RagA family TonB-linked outer membrane protein [Flavobacterium sp. 7A]|uniref:SusC/RagA family TonB-linked outer membrane protein n=1 Tax=Flavobacterium sp. 7A TaxID=2940571 RepID=UPI0022275CE7|nr:TonB-dependent receptor [Flavobacterium sp. 7A]MCW2118792.1 TonB-linked SusC/RagA family outer membrane protein [Flavobacterium sp. 7A]
MRIKEKMMSIGKTSGFLMIVLLALFCTTTAKAQEITVQGVIKSADDGMPIPGATVIIKGTTKGTVTNFDGEYAIKAKMGDMISVSYIGMMTKNAAVTSKFLNVVLKSSSQDLDEVVVIGYGTVKKKEVTGAVSSLKASDIENFVTPDLGSAMQGQISGVNIVTSSEPGGTSEILIRGVTSVSGSNTPLFVVDGVPQEGDPGISPNDVESIDVLKDAASAAIYGTRGAAGVILITTKQGKAGTMQVRLDGSIGYEKVKGGIALMNTAQQTYFDMIYNRNLSPGTADDLFALNLDKTPSGFQNDTKLTDLLFVDNAKTQNYNLNLSGGTKDLTYSISTNLYDKTGVVRNTSFQRFNTRANANYNKGKWKINASVGVYQEQTSRGASGAVNQLLKYKPTQASIDFDNLDGPILSEDNAQDLNSLGNVLASFNNSDITKSAKSLANFNLGYELAKGLNVSSQIGFNQSNSYRKRFVRYQPIIFASGADSGRSDNSSVQNDSQIKSSLVWTSAINYKKSLGDHNFGIMVAYTREQYNTEQFSAQKFGVLDNAVQVLNGTTNRPEVSSGPDEVRKLTGFITRFQYDYKGKYLISSSIRRDGSTRFGEKNRYGTFPSVALAWNVSDEAFWSKMKGVVNNFKVRLSSGTVGNESIPSYQYSGNITPGYDYVFGGTLNYGLAQDGYANPLIKWETSKQNNIGIDLGLFKNKVTVSAEYYNTSKDGMLFPVTLPGSASGVDGSTVIYNIGDMTNSGFELAVGLKGKINKLNYRMNSTFTTNQNVIKKINGEGSYLFTDDSGLVSGAKADSQITVLAEGHEAGAFYLFTTNGIANTPDKLADYQKIVPTAKMGDLIYKDNNNDGAITNGDRVYSGSGLAKYQIGYNLNLDYKGFDLSFNLYAALGQEIMNGAKATAYGNGRSEDLVYSWSTVNPDSNIPAYRGDIKSHPNYKGYTDQWLEDGSYLRVKNITFGYSLPKKLVTSLGVSKFRLYVTAQNPFTFTKYTGFDPEIGGGINSRGLDKGNYPLAKFYLVGLNFNF